MLYVFISGPLSLACSSLLQNKELEDRLKKLRFDLGNKSYQEMTRTIIGSRSPAAAADVAREGRHEEREDDPRSPSLASPASLSSISLLFPAFAVRQLRPILITLVNSLMVVGATFFFVFKAVEYSMPQPDVTVQVLVSLVAAVVVAIAELYFLSKVI